MNKTLLVTAVVAAFSSTLYVSQADETATVLERRLNVRGHPSISAEVINQLKQGEEVVILEEVKLDKPKAGEPTNWAKIKLPSGTAVWTFSDFIDTETKQVKSRRLNLRSGPGENFSVIGRLEKGAPVSIIQTNETWFKIEPPTNAFAFVSLDHLSRGKSPAPMADAAKITESPKETAQPEPAKETPVTPEKKTVAEAPPTKKEEPVAVVPPPVVETKSVIEEPAPVLAKTEPGLPKAVEGSKAAVESPANTVAPIIPAPVSLATNVTAARATAKKEELPQLAPAPEPVADAPLPRRIVSREGIVKSTLSIQAPTYFELVSAENGTVLNYLHAEKSGLNLKNYKGKRILVTGEEGIDPRWPRTPVIELETLEVAP